MVFTNLSPFPVMLTPITNISPLTYRDASTFLEYLETIKQWLNETLVPDSNTMISNAVTEMQAAISNAENTTTAALQEWDGRFDQYSADLSAQVQAVQDAAVKLMVDNATGPTGAAIRALLPNLAPLTASVTTAQTDITNLQTSDAAKIPATQKAAANGVATLGADSLVPFAQLPSPSAAGNLSARPLATAVIPGFTYYSLDTRETYRSTGTAWVSVGKGGRLGSASIITNFETSSTDLVDVTGLAVTFTAGSGIAKITLSGEASQTVNNGTVILTIEVNGEDSGHVPIAFPVADTSATFTRVIEKTTLVPGTVYTAKVKMLVGASGGYGKLQAQTYNPVTLLVESV